MKKTTPTESPAPAKPNESSLRTQRRRPTVLWAMLAVVVWCSAIAAGPIVYGQRLAVVKSLIILASMSIFLGVWAFALWVRRRRDLEKGK